MTSLPDALQALEKPMSIDGQANLNKGLLLLSTAIDYQPLQSRVLEAAPSKNKKSNKRYLQSLQPLKNTISILKENNLLSQTADEFGSKLLSNKD